MHPYAIDRMVQERQAELARLRQVQRAAAGARRPSWGRRSRPARLGAVAALVAWPGRRAPCDPPGASPALES